VLKRARSLPGFCPHVQVFGPTSASITIITKLGHECDSARLGP